MAHRKEATTGSVFGPSKTRVAVNDAMLKVFANSCWLLVSFTAAGTLTQSTRTDLT